MQVMTDLTEATSQNSYREPRRFPGLNTLGLWTLYKREVGRFIKVGMQTLLAPAVSTLLLMTVFRLAFGNRGELTGDFAGVAYQDFLAPGLVIMTVLQNAFQNTSSSLTIAQASDSTYCHSPSCHTRIVGTL